MSKEEGKYDSETDTLIHINIVGQMLLAVAKEIADRSQKHDASKLVPPEKDLFDKYTPMLPSCTYGSKEYETFLGELKPALDHHYVNNSHHPEHYPNGIEDMNLFDLVEMFFDWWAATKRHNDGNILKSIDYNETRFGVSHQLSEVFINTVSYCMKNLNDQDENFWILSK